MVSKTQIVIGLAVAVPLPAQDEAKLSVQRFKAPLLECVVSADGSTSVVRTDDGFLHFRKASDGFGARVAAASAKRDPDKNGKKGRNDEKAPKPAGNSFRYKIDNIFLSSDGQRLFGRIGGGTMAIVTQKPKVLHQLRGLPGARAAALHPDGVQLAVVMRGGLARILDTNTGKPLFYMTLALNKSPTWIGFTADGKSLMLATDDKRLRYFAMPEGTALREIETPEPIRYPSFTARGKIMVSHSGQKVQIRKVATGAESRSFDALKPVARVAVSGDGKMIAVAHKDGSVALHDASTGKPTLGWMAHADQSIVCLQFIHAKGRKRQLITAAEKGEVISWDLAKLESLAAARSRKAKGKRPTRKRVR